jgi:nocardicin N-oxygenase
MTVDSGTRAYPFGEPEGLDVHPTYAKLREQPGMAKVQPPFGGWTWLATRYDDVKTVLTDARFSRAKIVGESEPRVHPFIPRPDQLSAMDPPAHTRLRRVLAGAFTGRRMEQLRPRVQQIADELLGAMEAAGSPADLVAAYALPMPLLVITEVLGVPYADHERFRGWSDKILSRAGRGLTREQIMEAHGQMHAYLASLVAGRRERPADDLLGVLVEASDVGEKLTENEVITLATSVLIAGHETTLNQIASFAYVLMTHPDRLRELRERPDLIEPAVEELLRVAPVTATAGFARIATEDVEMGDMVVGAGDAVMPTLFSANMDERAFPCPERLDFSRENVATHLSFSHGAHHCPGSPLARVELQVAIASLVRRFPGLRLAVPADQVPWKKTLLARGPERLPIAW